MKKVLIITYYWPPNGGSGVQRWLKFSKYLRDFGWEPVIYTPENPEIVHFDDSLEKDIKEKTTVVKTKIWEPFSIYKAITGKKKNDTLGAGFMSEKKGISFTEKLSVWIRSNFFIPDARVFWIKPSVKYLTNYLTENPVDIIVSTGPPHSMHLIALGLKKKLQIPWVADFRDPWTNIDFYDKLKLTKRADKKHRTLEKNVLRSADKVVSVSWNWAKDYIKKGAKDVEVITNGYDPDDFPEIKNNREKDGFIICQFGSVNKDRNHDVFWKAISDLINKNNEVKEKLKILFIGSIDFSVTESISKYNLESLVEKIGYLPHKEALETAAKADVLYLPLNNTPNVSGIIPGKVFEYLALKKPILSIGDVNGDTAKILKETQSGVMFDFNNKNGIEKWLLDAFHNKKNLVTHPSSNIEKYSRIALTKQMASLFNKIINEKPNSGTLF